MQKSLVFYLLSIALQASTIDASSRSDGRYSYSLTTFDPEGRLGQVDRAMQAAALGAPLIAISMRDEVILAAPQVLPSPLMQDDGTSRFALITSEISVGHSGLSADGRVLVAAAQRLAVQHHYTYDEEIPIDIFLEELSMIFQEYTVKPATRPFGATIVVAYVPSRPGGSKGFENEEYAGKKTTQIFRVDPSGTVSGLGKFAIINGGNSNVGSSSSKLRDTLVQMTTTNDEEEKAISDPASVVCTEAAHEKIASTLRFALAEQSRKQKDTAVDKQTILTSVLSRTNGFSLYRH